MVDDTIVTTKGNSIGRTSFISRDMAGVVYSPHLSFWRSLDHARLVPGFLRYWARGPEFRAQLEGMMISTDMAPYLSLLDQRRLRVLLPPLRAQQLIAEVLGALDEKIELNRRMNRTLDMMAQSLFKSWFVDYDAVMANVTGAAACRPSASMAKLFPHSFENSVVGDLPKDWKAGRLADLVELVREQENPFDAPDELFAHYSIPAFDNGQMPVYERGSNIRSLKFRVPLGAVLLSKLNPETDRTWLVDVKIRERPVCSTEFLVLSARPPFGSSYIYCLLRSRAFRQDLEALVTGTSNSHQRAQIESILNLKIVIPTENVISECQSRIIPLLARMLSNRQESRTLAALRDALLPKLLSGEIDVQDAEAAVERAGA